MEETILDELIRLKLRVSALEDLMKPFPSFGPQWRGKPKEIENEAEPKAEPEAEDNSIFLLFEKTE